MANVNHVTKEFQIVIVINAFAMQTTLEIIVKHTAVPQGYSKMANANHAQPIKFQTAIEICVFAKQITLEMIVKYIAIPHIH